MRSDEAPASNGRHNRRTVRLLAREVAVGRSVDTELRNLQTSEEERNAQYERGDYDQWNAGWDHAIDSVVAILDDRTKGTA